MANPGIRPSLARLSRALVAPVVVALALGPLAVPGAAAGTLTMSARVLLQGHTRSGAWSAIEVTLQNDGPRVTGELRMDGGDRGRARFAMAVDLPTSSRQVYVLHAQPPSFGQNVKVSLVSGEREIDSATVAYITHEAVQTIVGVLAEKPQGLIGQIDLPNSTSGSPAVIVPLTIADLPERAEGWSVLDRLVWQDVDSNQLSTGQLDALRRWIAAGGRLVVAGGSAGIGTLSAFPDDMLPYRPTATIDLDPGALTSLIGALPVGASELPAMAGELARGRALVTSGDRVAAAELAYGSGRITLLGFDPTTKWLGESKSVDGLWRSLLPARSGDAMQLFDDSQLIQAIYQLPSLALPPINGLLAILAAYILIIGPINYLVLRRLDRRELAWITMPVLVVGFAAVAFGYGAFLRGTDVVVNQVAIVRGAPDATEATAQVYFGVFSPTRATYRVQVDGGALLASPISGDPFGMESGSLDIVQGTGTEQPSEVRNLNVGTSSLRTVRAEVSTKAPRIRAALTLSGNILTGTVENLSDQTLEQAAVVLGGSVAVLGDIAPGASVSPRLTLRDNTFGGSIADILVGSSFESASEAAIRRQARYAMVNQLTLDPSGQTFGQISGDQAIVLAFGNEGVLGVNIAGQSPRQLGNVLYYVPVNVAVSGKVTFSSDLLRQTLISADAQFFQKEKFFMSLGAGTATIAYRPIAFSGTFAVSEVRMSIGQGGGAVPVGGGKVIEPLPSIPVPCTDSNNTVPAGCQPNRLDSFLPDVEVFDLRGEGQWVRLPQMVSDAPYSLANPERYVDPATGQVLVRFVNDNPDASAGFGFQLALEGEVR